MPSMTEYSLPAKNAEVQRLRDIFSQVKDTHMSEAGVAYAKKASTRRDRLQFDSFDLERALRVHWRGYDYGVWMSAMDNLASRLKLQDAKLVFEAGFGSGAPLGYFNQNFPQLGVAGNDLFEPYIELARKSEHIANGAFLQVNSTHLDCIPDSSIDAVFSWGALCYDTKESASQTIHQLIRICKPGGRILVGNINNAENLNKNYKTPYKTSFTSGELAQEVADRPVTILDLDTDRKVLGFKGHQSSSRLTVCMEKTQ